jgi:hypothetical protein
MSAAIRVIPICESQTAADNALDSFTGLLVIELEFADDFFAGVVVPSQIAFNAALSSVRDESDLC